MRMAILAGLVCLITAAAQAGDGSDSEIIKRIVARLQPVVAELTPRAVIKTDESDVTVLYLTQTFKIHGVSMTGEISREAHDEVGPSYKGLIVSVQVQDKGAANQAVTPQTVQRPYWQTYIQETPLEGTQKQLYWSLSYGTRTDAKVMEKVRQAIEGMGGK